MPASQPVTLKTLARRLNLSPGTVSKALHDSFEISPETKARVNAMAAALHYVPNHLAASLRHRQSKTIAVIVPEIADSFFAQAIDGVHAAAQRLGYHVIIAVTNEKIDRERAILRELDGGRADGILISVSRETCDGTHLDEFRRRGLPVVMFDRVAGGFDGARVVTSDRESGYLAGKHLAAQGCRRLLFLSVSDALAFTHLRYEGFAQAAAEAGLGAPEVLRCSNEAAGNLKLIRSRLSRAPRPDGVLASVELLATPVYQACRELGLRIPQDVRMIAFANVPSADFLDPGMTTVVQPAFEMGRTAADLLCRAIDDRTFVLDQHIVHQATLEPRGSTVAPEPAPKRRRK